VETDSSVPLYLLSPGGRTDPEVPIYTGVRYSVGNPMGAYSSWASFAVAHHFVVYDCCRELGIPFSSAKYVLLGDDILIGDEGLASAYRSRLKSLGVEISALKTLESFTTLEFAKRYVHMGEEVSPFPLSVISSSYKSVPLVVAGILGEGKKGLIPSSGVSGSVGELFRALRHRAADCRRAENEARKCEYSHRFSQGSLEARTYILHLLTLLGQGGWGHRAPRFESAFLGDAVMMSDETANLIIDHAVVKMFTSSLGGRGLNLGVLMEELKTGLMT